MGADGENMIRIAVVLVATAGVGASVIAPRQSGIGWILLAAAVGGIVSLIRRHHRESRARDGSLSGGGKLQVNRGSSAHGIR